MSNPGLLNPFGNGGRPDTSTYYSNLDKNMYLSASDMGKTITITNSNGYGVVLPDARQLIKNVVVNIANKSTTPISVFNNNGAILKVIPVNQVVLCWCTSKTSSSGLWSTQILGTSLFNSVGIGTPVSVWTNGLSVSKFGLCQFSNTAVLISFIYNAYLYAFYLSVSNSLITVSYGASRSISTYPSYTSMSMCYHSAAAALIVMSYKSADTYLSYAGFVVTVDTANSTVTIAPGSTIGNMSLAAGLASYGDVVVTEVSTNKFAVSSSWYFYSSGNSTYYTYAPIYYFTMSGNTVSASSYGWSAINAQWTQIHNICAVDSNTIIVGYTPNSISVPVIKKFNVVTGTPSELISMELTGSSGQFSVVPVTNTLILITTNVKIWLVNTADFSIITSITHGQSVSYSALTKLTASTYMLVTIFNQKQSFTQITLNGSAITLSNQVTTTTSVSSTENIGVAKLTDISAVGVGNWSTETKLYATFSKVS